MVDTVQNPNKISKKAIVKLKLYAKFKLTHCYLTLMTHHGVKGLNEEQDKQPDWTRVHIVTHDAKYNQKLDTDKVKQAQIQAQEVSSVLRLALLWYPLYISKLDQWSWFHRYPPNFLNQSNARW